MGFDEILKDMGIADFDNEDTKDSQGFISTYEIENPNRAIRQMEKDFGLSTLCVYPFWLRVPFDIQTGKKMKNNSTTSLSLKCVPDDLIRIVCKMAANSEEYKKNVQEAIGKKGEEFILEFDEKTGKICQETLDLFTPYVNTYAVSAPTQRFAVSEDKTITRLAVMATNDFGKIDHTRTDERLLVRYAAESALVDAEIKAKKAELEKANESKKTIEDAIKSISSSKVVTPPRITTAIVCFAFKSNSAGKPIEEELERVCDTSYDIGYSLRVTTATPDAIKSIKQIISNNKISTLNYALTVCVIPEKSTEIPNLGIACGKMKIQSVGDKINIEGVIPEFYRRLSDAVKKEGNISEERIRGSFTKFESIDIDTVLSYYASNLGKYKRALNDPAVISSNIKVLSKLKNDLGIKLISDIAESNKTTSIEVDYASINDDNDETEEQFPDSEDIESSVNESTVEAKDFV